ncbi:unnamed protein product [Blepharisma stoltei]|uniref:Peptidase M14 domain-containing protein n=1 Tax=Blepharisma stoltei TaxID=1481888 RepID=A0AAU9JVC0_9CILI|nr:unnamed protein product [Blepharisma stoltei]
MKNLSTDSGFENESSEYTSDIFPSNISPAHREIPELKEDRLPDFIPLAKSGHSLEADMLFGWRPTSILQNGPVPLSFTLDRISTQNAIFYGFRPTDSLELHECYSSPETYKFTINPTLRHAWNTIKKLEPNKKVQPFKGMKTGLNINELIFSSCFESGNLDKVVKVKENEYDLYIRTDSNSYGHNWWYYFKVENKWNDREVKFNIVNFSKRSSLYNQGNLPCIFDINNPAKGWFKGGNKVSYTSSKANKPNQRRIYYCLSFSYQFKENDAFYFAYSVPYRYSKLCNFVKELEKSNFVKNEVLCKSLSGVDVPILTITDFMAANQKEIAFLTARVHPGETHGSWVMEGLLKFLISDHHEAKRLRKKIIFKIVPMLNPDGVILGNGRCSLTGEDLNRRFHSPDPRLHPIIYSLKNAIKKEKISFYFDFHAHSTKKGMFMYGPHYPLHSDKYISIKVLPKLFSEKTEMFRYFSCKFQNDWSKRKSARLAIWKELKLPFVYTIETSSYGYLDNERNTVPFNEELLNTLGRNFCEALLEYIIIRNRFIKEKETKKTERLKKKKFGKKDYSAKEGFNARSLLEIMNCIKEENIQEDSDSEPSESEDEEFDPEYEEQQQKINQKILKVLDKAKNLMGFGKKESCSALRSSKKDDIFEIRESKEKLPKSITKIIKSSLKLKKLKKSDGTPHKYLLNDRFFKPRPSTSVKPRLKIHEIRKKQINDIQSIKPNVVDVSFKRRKFLDKFPNQRYKHIGTEKNSESPFLKYGDFNEIEQNDGEKNRAGSVENISYKHMFSRYKLDFGCESPTNIETVLKSEKRLARKYLDDF